jgi:hypothetical protein
MALVPNRNVSSIGLVLLALIGAALAQPKERLSCEGILIAYEKEVPLALQDGNGGVLDLVVPVATFTIRAPEKFKGRTVRLVYERLLSEPGEAVGDYFELEVPADYFDGADGRLILGTYLFSINRKAPVD